MRLSVEHISIERGGRLVLRDLSFAVVSGEALILTGPNGAGKTSLLRAIAGFLRPVAGQIRLDGRQPDTSPAPPIAEQCHWIGHLNGVKGNLTISENLAFWSAYLSQEATTGSSGHHPPDNEAILTRFALSPLADIPARALSAGQTRRLALTRLFAAHRPIWLLDEPTVSLDTASQQLLTSLIDAHTAADGIVVAATHIPLGLARTRTLSLAPSAEAA